MTAACAAELREEAQGSDQREAGYRGDNETASGLSRRFREADLGLPDHAEVFRAHAATPLDGRCVKPSQARAAFID
jgi:hypothetical protein